MNKSSALQLALSSILLLHSVLLRGETKREQEAKKTLATSRNDELAVSTTLLKRSAVPPNNAQAGAQALDSKDSVKTPLTWRSPARLHHTAGTASGDLILSDTGVEFRSTAAYSQHWPFAEIRTLDIEPRRLFLTGYQSRGRLRPGTRQFRFDLESDMPPRVAAEMIERVGKPVRNGDPESEAESITTIAAFHRIRFGGSNGILRFRKEGIDYLTKGDDRRSWRWADIQTLSDLDPYHFVVYGYREVYSFELKSPLPSDLYERVSDELYLHNQFDPPLGLRIVH